ncbi:Hypothetical protein R9X50_00750200 [Acrodontium crateriforme]|uniref:Uncharacterized protein n=1 Tax=Acrodontium crateriforme TaxID=150365 RepID=A0AAQ3MBG7_9PEZI|nr:Hypothetical protein R9X50_00750200 [Acrodontium crateriforme]
MANDALQSITTLLDTVPAWIADLEKLAKETTDRRTDALSRTRLADDSSPRKQKPTINVSVRSQDSTSVRSARRNNLSSPTWPSHCKQKTSSLASGDDHNASVAKPKTTVPVYYDGDVQKQFERIVRAIGSNRNALRRGKMCVKVDALSRSGSTSSNKSTSSTEPSLPTYNSLDPKAFRGRRTERSIFGFDDGTKPFDQIDSFLEKGQAFCEKAAHQILRDGTCSTEIRNATAQFAQAIKAAEIELPVLKHRSEKAAERRQRSAERRQTATVSEPKLQPITWESLPDLLSSQPTDIRLEVDDSLVDDDSEDDCIDLPVLVLPTRKYQQMDVWRTAVH